MTTGYKTLTPIQLGNLLHALATRQLPWVAARVWLACVELVAIREAAKRVRRLRRDRRVVQCDFQRAELEAMTGLNGRSVTRALGSLQRMGLVVFKATVVTLSAVPMLEAGETIRDLAGGRSALRPIPVPRTVLRFLAAQEAAALGRVMLGYVCRGLSIDRVGGALREAGTVKASWLAETLGLSLRSIRYAQAELRSVGWIGKDVGSKQWKLNRHGAWFRINLGWKPGVSAKQGDAFRAVNGAPVARPTPDFRTSVAPLKENRKTPSESKNQKPHPGVFKTTIRSLPAPSLRNILRADLHAPERLRQLQRQAVARGWVSDCQADALNFFAAAVRARSTSARDPIRVFVGLVRGRLWGHLTQTQEDEARRMLRPVCGSNPADPGRTATEPASVARTVAAILDHLVGEKTAFVRNPDLPIQKPALTPYQTRLRGIS